MRMGIWYVYIYIIYIYIYIERERERDTHPEHDWGLLAALDSRRIVFVSDTGDIFWGYVAALESNDRIAVVRVVHRHR